MILYFSKINMNSTELFDVYKDKGKLFYIRGLLLQALKDNTIYTDEKFYYDEDKVRHDVSTIYKMRIKEKTDTVVHGIIYKNAKIYSKEENKSTGELKSKIVPTIEDVKFYFDVTKEIVGFHTRNRFGYQEFNIVFENLLNAGMKEMNQEFSFSVSLYNEGVDINEIENKLKEINNIKRLIFDFKLPNPSDDNLLSKLEEGLDDTLEQLETANAHCMSVIFDSDGKIGLNIDSEEIQKNIIRIGKLHSAISDKKATKNNYASVKAIGKNGKIYSTEEEKPIKRAIDHESEFLWACADTIKSLFRG